MQRNPESEYLQLLTELEEILDSVDKELESQTGACDAPSQRREGILDASN